MPTFASVLLSILDREAASYHTTDLNAIANSLAGLGDLIRGGGTALGFEADTPILNLLPAAIAQQAAARPDVIIKGIYQSFYAGIQSLMSQMQYANLNAYATAQNAATRDSFLIAPNAALQNWLYTGKIATLLLSPGNVFAPQTVFGSVTVGPAAHALVFDQQDTIPTANTTNPAQQGYTPAPGLTAQVTATINGTLTVTLTGSGRTAGGALVDNRTWTAVLNNTAVNALIPFTPAVAGDRIASVTGATATGTATAGAFDLLSTLERIIS